MKSNRFNSKIYLKISIIFFVIFLLVLSIFSLILFFPNVFKVGNAVGLGMCLWGSVFFAIFFLGIYVLFSIVNYMSRKMVRVVPESPKPVLLDNSDLSLKKDDEKKDRPKKIFFFFSMMLLIILAGILSYNFFGFGLKFSFNSSGLISDTKTGLKEILVQKGYVDDTIIKESIISAFRNKVIIFTNGDYEDIRQYFINSAPESLKAEETKHVVGMSDESLSELKDLITKIGAVITDDILRSPNTVWTFSKNRDRVKVEVKIPTDYPNNYDQIAFNMIYINGGWY